MTSQLAVQVMEQIIYPTVRALSGEGIAFKGVLYAGLMLTADGPKVLEYNVRFGDPEAQAILPMLKSDLVHLLDDTVEGRLAMSQVEWLQGSCACVVLACGGYPGDFAIGKEIRGLESLKQLKNVWAFHGGTKRDDARVLSWGGRVLNVAATGIDLEAALKQAYEAIGQIGFDGMQYRTDIGHRALKKPVGT
jgi:phosphoribosylamine--glycine ligase